MINNKLNYAMAQIRHLSPEIYLYLNELRVKEIGSNKVFKFKSVLTHLLVLLEKYLVEVQEKFKKLEKFAKKPKEKYYID